MTGVSPTLGVTSGSIGFVDFNADGDLDFIVTGRVAAVAGGFVPTFSAIYRNRRMDFNGIPTPPPRFDFVRLSAVEPVWLSNHAFTDMDGDGDMDLALIGATQTEAPYAPITKVYQVAGNDFIEIADLPGLYNGSVEWGDFDNDGDADLLATGVLDSGDYSTTLYENDGLTFTPLSTTLPSVGFSDAEFVDVDNDFDLDIAIAGVATDGALTATIYRNDGNGIFSEIGNDLAGGSFASMDWGDYDSDGDLDLALSGGRPSPSSIKGLTRIYNNDGTGLMTGVADAQFGTYYGDTDWIDYDRDGDLDLFTVGVTNPFSGPRTQILINTSGAFSARSIQTAGLGASPVVGLAYSASAWGDFDQDNDLDLLLTGETFTDSLFFGIYGNMGGANLRANAPFANLNAVVAGSEVTLSWDPGSDTETMSLGLTYNLRVGTSPGSTDVFASNSLADGGRQLIRRGNVGSNTGWRLRDLSPGTYYWSVQSIDTDLMGSFFSLEQTFEIN